MTDQQTTSEPIAEVMFDELTAVLFDDGAVVTLGVGDGSCSQHRSLTDEQCDHSAEEDAPVPSFAAEMFVGAAATDRAVQDEVISRLLENDPERLSGFAEEI